ncbi:Mandelate racemase/muconate lactonizing protein [Beutenbergia cavernae DSM 12333]|uniref:Mandelate racemase/muconate lactonizing protein n=1 Tax=Beutenbergia cavernae (strain ATCC BAA-8 / DSM 12333 / CCUG 43141 / JCM 11478 / NBRC 16432 / NCIMB 13614 / HKI 0122) TaxID=471853 RepID=C5C428_BEUC1|nr:enolase C-terminal domain-like protein [Beutenbergia cavernae]ACQ79941.1 Mandelate racemase/muconate lactonizing protein [Beutenbergia cavernae DSM 12333]
MRVTDVTCVEYVSHVEAPEPIFADRLRRPTDVYPEFRARGPQTFREVASGRYEIRSVFLHVDTDTGLRGSTAQLSPEQAFIVSTVLRPLLLGADPLATERLWDVLYRSAIHGRAGAGMTALSAVDCALWDIRGQHLGVPAHVLLGGPTRSEIPAYASTLGDSLEPEHVAARTRELVAQGFAGLKWFPRWGPEDGAAGVESVVELVGTVRDAAGDGVAIMLDAWSGWDVPFTLEVARATRDQGVAWIEEPLLADQLEGYRTLRRRLPDGVRIAGGEHEYTRWGYRELLAADVLDLHQPDPHWAGGISELTKIMALISAAGGQLVPHGQSLQCNAALSFAASPALVPQMEYLARLMPMYQHVLREPVVPVGGVIAAPTAPGLGMTVDPAKVVSSRVIGGDAA